MLSAECMRELKTSWLPNITENGLDRLVELLERGSPLLIHGSFTRAVPMGCLATHIAWNHPQTARHTLDAGICWLNHVAGLNPATSQVIREWDRSRRLRLRDAHGIGRHLPGRANRTHAAGTAGRQPDRRTGVRVNRCTPE